MARKGPLVTLAAAVVIGGALLAINTTKQSDDEPAPAAAVTATTTTTVDAAPTTTETAPETEPAQQFPALQDYVGNAANGGITVSITVEGDEAVAYVCDGAAIEAWLTGSAVDGVVDLRNDKGATLVGTLADGGIDGTLAIPGQAPNTFVAAPVDPPSGIYVSETDGVRQSWIVDGDTVVGVQRDAQGNTSPAPAKPAGALKVSGGDTDAF